MNFLGIGFIELVIVLVVALLILGPNKMVEAARTLGKYMRELQRANAELPRLLSLDEDLPKKPTVQRQQISQEADSQGTPTDGKEHEPGSEV